METYITYLIYIHATFGGIAFIAGFIALLAKKGKTIHKKSGITFYYCMLFSAITALIISVLPKHENPFLFTVGLFSSYFILAGYRALRFKKGIPNLTIDRIISGVLLFTGIAMISYPLLLHGNLNMLLCIFGILGIGFSVRDFRLFNNPEKLKKSWLQLHVGKMTGGYIAAVTAFIVVNQFIPGIIGWIAPGIIGSVYISYWMRKLRTK